MFIAVLITVSKKMVTTQNTQQLMVNKLWNSHNKNEVIKMNKY